MKVGAAKRNAGEEKTGHELGMYLKQRFPNGVCVYVFKIFTSLVKLLCDSSFRKL